MPALSSAVSTSAKVWAFEPNPESFRCAKITTYLNDIDNVELTHAGLGESEDSMLVLTSHPNGKARGGASKIVDSTEDNIRGNTTPVKIVSIDSIIPSDRQVSIIQLDVEGYEKQALMGALNTIKRCSPIIVVEVLKNSTLLESDWFLENILSLGYQKTGSIHLNTIFEPHS